MGNNEDWVDSHSRLRFVAAAPGAHGRVVFGFRFGGVQGGMNDAGLFIDATAQNPLARRPSAGGGKSTLDLVSFNLLDRLLKECGSVQEALRMLRDRNGPDRMITGAASFLLCDQTGDAAVYEGDDVVLSKQRDVLTLTNFRVAEKGSGPATCVRYNTATRMLSADEHPTIESIRDVLAATTQTRTQYSVVFDLKNKDIYIYHFHNFHQVRRFRLQEETGKGDKAFEISSLFPANPEFQEYQNRFDESLQKQRENKNLSAIVAKGTKDFIASFDANGDGKIDLGELTPYGSYFREVDLPLVRSFDRDNDGYFDGDELVHLSLAICPPVLLGGKPLP